MPRVNIDDVLEATVVAAQLETGHKVAHMVVGYAIWAMIRRQHQVAGQLHSLRLPSGVMVVTDILTDAFGVWIVMDVRRPHLPHTNEFWVTDLAEGLLDLYLEKEWNQ